MSSNKLSIFLIAGLFLISGAIFLYFLHKKKVKADEFIYTGNELLLDTYGHSSNLQLKDNPDRKHIILKWNSEESDSIGSHFKNEILSTKSLLLTLEIWPDHDTNVLNAILDGKYDQKINDLAASLATHKDVMIRLLPYMEVPVKMYPWQYQSPVVYNDAFNYLSVHLKEKAPYLRIVWSPAGYPGDSEYWPGNAHVDAISITLNSKAEKSDLTFPANKNGLYSLLQHKIHRLRFMDKPVLVLSSDTNIKSSDVNPLLERLKKQTDSFKNTIYSSAYYTPNQHHVSNRKKLNIGVYDPKQSLTKNTCVTAEHLFTNWGEIQTGSFKTQFQQVVNRHHDVIITIEPWRDRNQLNDPQALQNTLKGKYDKELTSFYQTIANPTQHVYLRWAHEMELPIHRYTWQSQSPIDYINSFRYVMNFQKKDVHHSWVWGPAGDRGSADWYPGDDVVDYISVAIYGLPDRNITDQNLQESFSSIFQRKIYRMRFFNKPIFITEFGVKGDQEYKKKWLLDASKVIIAHKMIYGICYFNLHDNPEVWGKIEAPDWSLNELTFRGFCESLH